MTRPASGLGSGCLRALLRLAQLFEQALPLFRKPLSLGCSALPLTLQPVRFGSRLLLAHQLRLPLCSGLQPPNISAPHDRLYRVLVHMHLGIRHTFCNQQSHLAAPCDH